MFCLCWWRRIHLLTHDECLEQLQQTAAWPTFWLIQLIVVDTHKKWLQVHNSGCFLKKCFLLSFISNQTWHVSTSLHAWLYALLKQLTLVLFFLTLYNPYENTTSIVGCPLWKVFLNNSLKILFTFVYFAKSPYWLKGPAHRASNFYPHTIKIGTKEKNNKTIRRDITAKSALYMANYKFFLFIWQTTNFMPFIPVKVWHKKYLGIFHKVQ